MSCSRTAAATRAAPVAPDIPGNPGAPQIAAISSLQLSYLAGKAGFPAFAHRYKTHFQALQIKRKSVKMVKVRPLFSIN